VGCRPWTASDGLPRLAGHRGGRPAGAAHPRKAYLIPQLGPPRRDPDAGGLRAGSRPVRGRSCRTRTSSPWSWATSSRRCARNNVPARAIVHAATVAHTDAQLGREAAEQMWEHGPNPQAAGSGDNGGQRKFDHLARYGRGRIIDEETGEYETYDVPDGEGRSFDWAEILDAPRADRRGLPVRVRHRPRHARQRAVVAGVRHLRRGPAGLRQPPRAAPERRHRRRRGGGR